MRISILSQYIGSLSRKVFLNCCHKISRLSQYSQNQFSSVAQLCLTLCNSMDYSTPGFPVHQLLELAQAHVLQVSDAIQPSYPLSSPSPPALNLSKHQGLFQWVQNTITCICADVTVSWRISISSVAQLCLTLWDPHGLQYFQASLSITNSQNLPKLMSIESVLPSNYLILCRPLLLPPSIFPRIRVFSNESVIWIRWPKYWSFSFNISPSNEYSGLISFRMDWLNFLAVQKSLKSLLQHHSSKASILWHTAFFTVQLSHPYMTTGKTIAMTRRPLLTK